MKITAVFKILLFMLMLAGFQQLYAEQLYTIDLQKVTLKQAARVIKEKTGYTLLYDEERTGPLDGISIRVRNGNIDAVMLQCLHGVPFTYTLSGKSVVIKPERVFDTYHAVTNVEGKAVSGFVTDEAGTPLAGATVAIKSKKVAVTTENNGKFTLRNVDVGDILIISYIGFVSQEYPLVGNSNIIIRLEHSKSQLDNVEIIAYGSTTRRLSTGNSGSVKALDIEKQPINNPLLALQGRVAGVVVTQASGMPGATLNIRIQGTNSLRGGNNPFYVVDGVPYTSSLLATSGGAGVWGTPKGNLASDNSNIRSLANEGSGNPFSYLNPADIESIEVLKDADATAIYGSRAANGAILITTKKGKAGQLHVDLNLKMGRQSVAQKLELLNAHQYLDMRREAKRNSNEELLATDYDLNGTWDTTRSTDWQKVMYGNAAGYFDGQLTVSGGNNNVSYLIGGGYNAQTTVLPGDFADKKASVHFSLRTNSSNQKFKLQLSGSYLVDNNTLPIEDPTGYAIYLSPLAPALFNADGSRNWALNSDGRTSWPGLHPYAMLDKKFKVNVNNFLSSMVLGYTVLPGLDVKTSMGYTFMQSNEVALYPLSAMEPADRVITDFREARFKYNTITSSVIEPQINYRRGMGNFKMDVLVGATIQQNKSRGRGINGYGQVSDNLLENLAAAKTVVSNGLEVANIYRYNALFGRFNFNYLDKYIITLTGRRDGSSRFGINNRFHNFGSVGGAWVFSEEKLIPFTKFLSFGKLKFSYGITGNDQIGDYTYLDLYRTYPVGVPYQGIAALTVNGLFNSKLQWERTSKMNVGLDLGFFNERILLAVNYARNHSSNLLQNAQMPSTAGLSVVTMNFPGVVRNTSLEFTVSSVNVKTKQFSWSTNLNLTKPTNKLVSFPDKDKLTLFSYQLDGPLGARRMYKYGGVNPQTGVYMFKDAKGNPVSNFADADITYVDQLPRLYGGLENSFSYKGIRLDVSFQFTQQYGQRFLFNGDPGVMGLNQPTTVLNRWQKPGDNAVLQRFSTTYLPSYITLTDAYMEDASFVRCKNVALSWELPSKWTSLLKLSGCRIALQTQNLFTWTRYSGLDPESGGSALPPMRVWVLSIQAGF